MRKERVLLSVKMPLGHVTDSSVRLVGEKKNVVTESSLAEDKHDETCQTVSSAVLQDADVSNGYITSFCR